MTDLWALPAVRWAIYVVLGAAVAVAISLLVPPIVALLERARTELRLLRERMARWASAMTLERFDSFWAARAAEPGEPVLAGIARVEDAAATLGRDQIESLERLDGHLQQKLQMLKAAASPAPVETSSDRQRITRALAGGGAGALFGLAFLALALGTINAALLSLFFREFLGARPALPTLLPEEFQIGHALALLFFVLELASGVLIYFLGPEAREQAQDEEEPAHRRSGALRFFYWSSWALLASLAVVELVAYAVLSDRLNIPAQLKIEPTSPFYSVARFFFAGFGLAMTAALSGIGHMFASAIHRQKRARAERQLLRALERRDDVLASTVTRVRQDVERIREAAIGLPGSVARNFHEALQLNATYPSAPLALYAAVVQSVSSTDPSARAALLPPGVAVPPMPPVRSRSQVIGDMGALLFGLAVLAVVSLLTTFEVVTWLGQRGSPLRVVLAWTAGVFVAAAAIGIGLSLRNTIARLRYATLAEQTLGGPRARRLMAIGYAASAILIALLLAAISVRVSVLRAGLIVNGLLGLVQAAVMLGLGGYLDAQLVALAHALFLGWLAAVRLLALAGAALAHITATACVLVEYVAKLIAIPGDVIRGLLSRQGRIGPPVLPASQV